MPKAHGYLRCSLDDQEVAAQRQQIQEYFDGTLKPRGFEWGDWYIDQGVSASIRLLQRTQGRRLNIACEAGDAIVIAKLDRGWRDTRDCLETTELWRARQVFLHLLDLRLDMSTIVGQMMLTIMSAVATFERQRLIERVKETIRSRRMRGMAVGGTPPYGFKHVGPVGRKRVVPYPEIRELGSLIVRWKEQSYSWEEIAVNLLRHQVKHPRTGAEVGEKMARGFYAKERALRAYEEKQRLEAAGEPAADVEIDAALDEEEPLP
jgi:DNA invertase Pin-like site-specific DNA recombinase